MSRSDPASACVRVRTPAWCVLRVAHRALLAAVPGSSGVAVSLIVRSLGRPRRGRHLGCHRGCRAARGQHGPAPGPSGVWLVVLDPNDAARLAPIARLSWVLAGRASSAIPGHPVTRPCWCGRSGSGRPDRYDPLLLGGHGDDEVDALTSKPDFHSTAPLAWRAKDVGGNDTYGITGNPYYG